MFRTAVLPPLVGGLHCGPMAKPTRRQHGEVLRRWSAVSIAARSAPRGPCSRPTCSRRWSAGSIAARGAPSSPRSWGRCSRRWSADSIAADVRGQSAGSGISAPAGGRRAPLRLLSTYPICQPGNVLLPLVGGLHRGNAPGNNGRRDLLGSGCRGFVPPAGDRRPPGSRASRTSRSASSICSPSGQSSAAIHRDRRLSHRNDHWSLSCPILASWPDVRFTMSSR